MLNKLLHICATLLFFGLGCAATLFFGPGNGPDLVTPAVAMGGTCVTATPIGDVVENNKCKFSIRFNKRVSGATWDGKTAHIWFDNPCPYNCQRWNSVAGRCVGPYMNGCD